MSRKSQHDRHADTRSQHVDVSVTVDMFRAGS
jgi:hypothetical protein